MSALLRSDSVPRRALDKARLCGTVLFSVETLQELADVLWRPKFDPYLRADDREGFLNLLLAVSEVVLVTDRVSACRDPRDDKFLEVAVNGSADIVVSGDADLLALHPFREIPIVTPAGFVG